MGGSRDIVAAIDRNQVAIKFLQDAAAQRQAVETRDGADIRHLGLHDAGRGVGDVVLDQPVPRAAWAMMSSSELLALTPGGMSCTACRPWRGCRQGTVGAAGVEHEDIHVAVEEGVVLLRQTFEEVIARGTAAAEVQRLAARR